MDKPLQQIAPTLVLVLASCVEPYDVKETSYEDVLAVEGFISNASKQHVVRLSRTSAINQQQFNPEQGATVSIQAKSQGTIPLTETQPGVYRTPVFAGTPGNIYRLQVTTKSGRSYQSEEVVLKTTPPIGNVYARYFQKPASGPDGVQLYLDTEDPLGNTRYYRWEYEETYEIQTPYVSTFVWAGGSTVVFRAVPVNRCWAMDTSRNVLIATTEKLQRDKITAFPIRYVSGRSQALVTLYSLLVKQYAMSDRAYFYWKTIAAVNEKQGSLFDTQPGAVRGNISATADVNEVVLGYFDAATTSEKRIFLEAGQFTSDGYTAPLYRSSCSDNNLISVPALDIEPFMTKYQYSLEIYGVSGTGVASYLLLPKPCCNCTDEGTNEKPIYWPN